MDVRATTTAALEPTWTTTSFFPKTIPLLHHVPRKLNRATPAPRDSTIACRRTTRPREAIPIKRVAVSRIVKVANLDPTKVGRFAVAAVAAVADGEAKET